MEALQARIDSFQRTRRVKRYPSKSSSSAASVRWPHARGFKANPDTLAEAGFFFNPSWDDRDSVACFLCGKELSDWDADDDPFEIHYSKCRNSCAWALVRCGLAEDMDDEGHFVFENRARLPSSKAMEKARLDTFGTDWWPHDGEPDHHVTSTKMAQAGFVYTPHTAGDDTATCLYCNLSLGGWEAEDDPVQEHRVRDSKSGTACPFLALSAKQTRSKPVPQSLPAKKPPAERDQLSDDELATVQIAEPPPPPRARRGKARTASTASSKSRRKTRATRGKPAKASATASRRSPSPSRAASHEPEEEVPDAPMAVDVPPEDPLEPDPDPTSRLVPLGGESRREDSPVHTNGSTELLSDLPGSPSGPSPPSKPETPPRDTAQNPPEPTVSLSPAGQPEVANSKVLLTQDERAMTLEQWIRQEIRVSYEKSLDDGQGQIELFKTRAAELRRCIEEL